MEEKTCLIALTFMDKDDNVIEEYFTSGVVEKIVDNEILLFERPDGSYFKLPYDEDTIDELEPGEYTNKTTGDVVLNPDYIITWEIMVEDAAEIADIKLHGYIEE